MELWVLWVVEVTGPFESGGSSIIVVYVISRWVTIVANSTLLQKLKLKLKCCMKIINLYRLIWYEISNFNNDCHIPKMLKKYIKIK